MNTNDIYEVIKKLVGSIEPVGSTHVDEARLKNTETLGLVVLLLVDDLVRVAQRDSGGRHSDAKVIQMACDSIRDISEKCDQAPW